MRNIGAVDDATEAQWFVDGLAKSQDVVGGLVPRCFDAYARILHPAWRVRRESGRLVRSPIRWSEIANQRGTIAHRLMQWPQVWGLPVFDDSAIEACVEAGLAPVGCPDEGRLPPQVAQAMCDVLSAHVGSAAPCWFGVWVGFGHAYKEGVPATRRLSSKYREWDLFRAPLDTLTANFFSAGEDFFQSANMAWPEDRSWCTVTGIDMNSTYAGGSTALIEAICRKAKLEAHEAYLDDPIWQDAENPPAPGNFRLGLICEDNVAWGLPFRKRMDKAMGRLIPAPRSRRRMTIDGRFFGEPDVKNK